MEHTECKPNIFEGLRVCWSNLTYPYFVQALCSLFFQSRHLIANCFGVLVSNRKTLKGKFRTRADSIINNRAKLSGGRKIFDRNMSGIVVFYL